MSRNLDLLFGSFVGINAILSALESVLSFSSIDALMHFQVIFEDDADIALKDHRVILRSELIGMKTDLMYLGWCESKMARPAFLRTHAHAVTGTGLV